MLPDRKSRVRSEEDRVGVNIFEPKMKNTFSQLGYVALALVTGALLFSSCNDDDDDSNSNEACFNLTTDGGTVTFDANCSQNAVGYEWNFGNGDEVSQIVPTVEYFYAEPGNYTVTLLATFDDGSKLSTQRTVQIEEICLTCSCVGPFGGGTFEVECSTSLEILQALCSPACTSMGGSETTCTCNYE